MILTQFYLQCLSHASYLIGDTSTGQAIVVDPRRDISEYLEEARKQGLTIVGVINTHFHADFVAGHLEMAAATGAWIGYGRRAEAEYEIRKFAHGDHLSLGEVAIEILETPGHTWESISLLVREHADDPIPQAVLTGDALFIGDVGRPDLAVSVGASADELARAMHHTIHEIFMKLPDEVKVLPAHGAGSACGKSLSDELESTIGAQRATNLSVQPMSEDKFVQRLTTGQPAAPAYFAVDAMLNRHQRGMLSLEQSLPPISAAQAREAIGLGVKVIDTRSPEEFANGHLVGAINVGIAGRFAETAGMIAEHNEEILIVPEPGRADEAGIRLSRIGFDRAIGYVENVDHALIELMDLVRTSQRVTPEELERIRRDDLATILDVRNPGERDDGAIANSLHIPLAELVRRHQEVPADKPVIVHCASGWRSSVGASVLRSLGHDDVKDLLGGYDAWQKETQGAPA